MRLKSLLLSLAFVASPLLAMAQEPTNATPAYVLPRHILSTKPQGLILGFNAQLESTLSRKWSVQNELYLRSWWSSEAELLNMAALASNLKWYFGGQVGNGLYLRAKVMGGKLLNPERLEGYRYMAGAGLGIGVQRPISRKWFFGFDFGVKLVAPLDQAQQKYGVGEHGKGNWTEYTLLSPASLFDVGFNIGYRL